MFSLRKQRPALKRRVTAVWKQMLVLPRSVGPAVSSGQTEGCRGASDQRLSPVHRAVSGTLKTVSVARCRFVFTGNFSLFQCLNKVTKRVVLSAKRKRIKRENWFASVEAEHQYLYWQERKIQQRDLEAQTNRL